MKKIMCLFTAFLISSCVFFEIPAQEPTGEVLNITPVPELTVISTNINKIIALQCETYLETAWGNQPEQWGYSEDKARRFSLLPLVFKSENEIYFSDFANLRILKYNGVDKEPMQAIYLTPFFPDDYVYSWTSNPQPPVSLISVSQDKIYVPYGYNQIGILSLNGEILNDIAIPDYYYNFSFPSTQDVAWVDREGNLYVFSNTKFVVFKRGWENLEWVKTKAPITRYFWKEYAVQGPVDLISSSNINVYEKDSSGSFSQIYSISIDTGAKSGFFPMFGVDNNGNAYVSVISKNTNEHIYSRYSLLTGEKHLGSIAYPYAGRYTTLIPSVSPNGTIYFIAYNSEDLSIGPKIIKCNFPS
ncbi:MAG TPA: hypothetical protein PKE62_07715 [Anaerolineales bacterium]|nr:hypothetical protein [Anaerolineales bacterium]